MTARKWGLLSLTFFSGLFQTCFTMSLFLALLTIITYTINKPENIILRKYIGMYLIRIYICRKRRDIFRRHNLFETYAMLLFYFFYRMFSGNKTIMLMTAHQLISF